MKKKVAISLLVIASTIAVGKFVTTSPNTVSSAQEITQPERPEQPEQISAPEYAKWGKVAMQNVISKYPKASIIDYLHVGKETGEKTSVEKFKLWLKEGEREFGVFVDITFNNQTEEIIAINYEETNQ